MDPARLIAVKAVGRGKILDKARVKRLEEADSRVSKYLNKLDGDEQMSVLTVACQERLIINFGQYGEGAIICAMEHLCAEVVRGIKKFLEEHPFPSTTVH